MNGMMMEPKGFKIEIKTVKRTKTGAMASDVSIAEFCEKIKDILRSYSTFDGNQHLAVTVHSCHTGYEVEDSVINLVPDQNGRHSSTDYTRNYWIGESPS